MEEISVVISFNELISIPRHEMIETHILWRLKKAGIPAKGTLLFDGLERGELTKEECPYTKDVIFTWKDVDVKYGIGDLQEVCAKCLIHEMFFDGGGSCAPDFCPECGGEDYVMFKNLSWWKKRKANNLFKKMYQERIDNAKQ